MNVKPRLQWVQGGGTGHRHAWKCERWNKPEGLSSARERLSVLSELEGLGIGGGLSTGRGLRGVGVGWRAECQVITVSVHTGRCYLRMDTYETWKAERDGPEPVPRAAA